MKRKLVEDKALGFDFALQIGGLESEALSYFEKSFNINGPRPEGVDNGRKRGIFAYNDAYEFCGLIWIDKDSGGSVMAHESAHAAMHVCKTLGIDPIKADEFQARYTGFLVSELSKLFYTKKKKR